ncbi:hypothetical protein DOTSEDRAFT_55398 [Dothistroma septosporum NZE10]|uniref:Acid phosphatase-like protein n=1 Tax=Dothistroma septosporum (strain NZE10 / CBS 128990) TaxID=675120 RepID=N1PJA4_DOTSN|nr:hypothetical protein DOTSEDRAFT_55398 [Dothistroma septosporum NZE10]
MAISGWGVFLIILVIVLLAAGGGYIGYTHYRARKLGLPPPSLNPFSKNRRQDDIYRGPAPAPNGIKDWVIDKWNSIRGSGSGRTAGGAYESTGYGGGGSTRSGGRRGFGPLDPDEAWDARVDNEASGYYEEQELGLQDPGHGPYGGSGYGHAHSDSIGVGGIEAGRGRSRSRQRELDERYDQEVHGGGQKLNPFGDGAEASSMSLRSVSPRPDMDTGYKGTTGGRGPSAHRKNNSSLHTTGSNENSPTERRSMFTEDLGGR